MLAAIVAGIALLLAVIGIYGVRTQFLSLGLQFLAQGIVLGVIGVWVTGKAMQSVLYGLPGLHVATLVGTAVVMAAASLVACLIPAGRASRVDPMIALRPE